MLNSRTLNGTARLLSPSISSGVFETGSISDVRRGRGWWQDQGLGWEWMGQKRSEISVSGCGARHWEFDSPWGAPGGRVSLGGLGQAAQFQGNHGRKRVFAT